MPNLPATHGALVDALAKRIFGVVMRPEHTAAVTAIVGKQPGSPLLATDKAVNGDFPYLVALVLDAPYFSIR